MGISIEQYQSRIGYHDNLVKTKDILSSFKDHFWSVMLMMFYLNVFYLPVLKQVVGQYKLCNDVMLWFSQMIFYKQQEQYVLTTYSQEMKYSLVKMLVSNV